MRKSKIILKKTFLRILAIFLCFSSTLCLGNYDDFIENLRQLGIDVDSILQAKQIDRYELTRLLNGVNCKDCIHPDSSMTSKYTYQRRSDFSNIDGNAFNDITYLGGSYKGQSYYYCVAYVGDNLWMRGYPNDISPICNGKFCGTRTTTLGEFLQVVVNIADQYIYHRYLVDWKKIKTWMDGLPSGSYADTYLTNDEKFLINKNAANKITGPIPDEESFQPYIKYCMFNLKDCGMQSFGAIGQGYWPVAELNVLYDNNIVEYTKFVDGQTNELVDGAYVLETLYNLFQIIDCSFNYDYDCDGLINKNDNCPNAYNPTQTDTDGDGIGDVCDDDIDGDSIKNPIGIVDDLGSVVISKYKNNMDNCLFVPNYQQTDSNLNGLGNECDKGTSSLGMYIKTSPIKTTAPASATFEAVTEGNVKGDFTRTFGDGSTAQGKKVTHTFEKFGLYTVQVTANGYSNNAKASTTILIGNNPQNNYALQLNTNKQHINAGGEITFTINKQGNFDNFQWNFGDGNSIMQTSNTITKRFKNEGIYMITVKGFKDGKIVAVANTIIGVGDNTYGTKISSNKIFINKGESITILGYIDGFSNNDISDISRDFGDTKLINKNLNQEHTYQKEGTYVITQTINLNNGVSLNNFTTISVGNQNIENSYAIETDIDKLVTNAYEDIGFTIKNIGTIPNPTLVVNTYNDGYSIKSYENLNSWPKIFTHQYSNGIFSPKNTVYIDNCISLSTEATIVIDDGDLCLKALLNGTLQQFKGDMDGDGIPDICDDDIDGDGYPNLIGMINPNKTGTEILDSDINTTILKLHKGICQLDNCPTIENQNQLDLNNNGRGDSCDNINIYQNIGSLSNSIFMASFNNIFNHGNNSQDSDGDGITDGLDACPTLPENYNGVQDFDGCPEIGSENNCVLTNYNYINQNFSVYPTIQNGQINIIGPTNPVPECIGNDCKNLCLGSVNHCNNCNGKSGCPTCEQTPEYCGEIIGGVGPYTITARCTPENIFHIWHDITAFNFSFADIFKGSCPCKRCHRFAKDINGLVSNIGDFSVCNEECSDSNNNNNNNNGNNTGNDLGNDTGNNIDNLTITHNPDDIVPPCDGQECNNICEGNINNCPSCNGNSDCTICQQNPQSCGSRSGGQGPYDLHARCDDDTSNIYSWHNITNVTFSFADYFELKNECRDCHRFVRDSKGLISNIGDFQLCPGSGDNLTITHNPDDIVPPCNGQDCNSICTGNINNCPSCNGNSDCTICQQNPQSCGSRSGGQGPYDLYARCDDDASNIYSWHSITSVTFSFANYFELKNKCRDCHWFVKDSKGLSSNTGDFQLCPGSGDDLTTSGDNLTITHNPDDIVPPCNGQDCNSICTGNINNCPSCNGNFNCTICQQNPQSCGSRSGGQGPYDLYARCDDDASNIYSWHSITSVTFSFANYFELKNKCRDCHWFVKDSKGLSSNIGDFQLCPGSGTISGPTGNITPICEGGNCTINECTGSTCNNCLGNNCLCVGDIQSCPNCPNSSNPACNNCNTNPGSCGCRTGREGPISITARCDSNPSKKYIRSNIIGQCFSFDNIFHNESDSECDRCHRYLTDKRGQQSKIKSFNVCGDGIEIVDPERPEYTCTGNTCNVCEGPECNVCIGNVGICNSCNGNINCELCQQSPELCGSRSGGQGPYEIQARCDDDLDNIYVRHNITDHLFSFTNIWTGECPCKSCNRKIKDINGLTSITGNFRVCADECNNRIDPIPIPGPIPNCQGDNCDDICTGDVNNCPCKDNPNCSNIECSLNPDCISCQDDPDHSASRTGTANGPFSVTARCDDDGQEFTRNNISGHCFNFSEMFEGTCEQRSCHRYVSASNGLRSSTSDFIVDAIDSNECISPSGPDPVPECTGNNCNNICVGDVSNCPCINNPSCPANECNNGNNTCDDCSNSPLAATWESQLIGPFTVTVVCDDEINIRSNINNHCLGLNNVLDGDCPCKICQRSVSVKGNKKTISSTRKKFQVCREGCEPTPIDTGGNNTGLISSGPAGPVIECEGNDCNNCIGDISNCSGYIPPNITGNGGTLCDDDPLTSKSNGTRTGGTGPYDVFARCDNNTNDIKHRSNIYGQCFPFDKYFEGNCPCNQCHWFVQDVDGIISDRLDFQVCKEECEGGDDIIPPIIIPDGPITTQECLACPCNYTDFGNTLSLNDDVKAILLDLGMTTLYSESIPVGIMQYLN